MYKPQEGRKVAIYFHPVKDGASESSPREVEMADYDPRTGSFTVPGREGYGIPPGKYRIAVVETLRREEIDKITSTAKGKRGPRRVNNDTNLLEATFGEQTSPFIVDLKSSTNLSLDMDSPAN